MIDIIERDRELARLADLHEAACVGRGGVALVTGAVALGKSTLLDLFANRAAESGSLTLTATASETEGELPLGVLAQLLLSGRLDEADHEFLDALITRGAEELDAQPAADLGPADVHGHTRISPARARIADRFCQRLVAIAERTPLVIVVDDAHHADAASLACLEYLLRRIRRTRIALVLGHRDEVGHADSAFRLNVLRQPHARVLELTPLTGAGVTELLASGLGAEPAGRVAAECLAVGGGNPLLTQALLADQCEAVRGRSGARHRPEDAASAAPAVLHVGDAYARAVLSCLRRGSALMYAAARGVAVLDGGGPIDQLVGLEPTASAAGQRALERAGLSADGRLRHPAGRAAVLADVTPDERARLHAAAAEIIHAAGRPSAEVAGHLLAAGRADPPWAVPVLEEAARSALSEGRVSAAIGYLRLARAACVEDAIRPRLTMLLVRAEWRLNPAVPARYLDELLGALDDGRLAVSDATVLVRALLWHGRTEDAARVFARLAEGDLAAGPEASADLRVTRAWLRSSFTPLLEHMPEADPAAEHRSAAGTTELRHRLGASAALDEVLTRGPSAQLVEDAERILRRAQLESMSMDAEESALLALTYGEQSRRAAPWCDKLIRVARERESPSRQARLSAIRAEISVRQGDLPGAERHAREGLDIIPAAGWGVTLGACLGSLLTALIGMGRHEDAARVLSWPVPDAMADSRYGLHYIRARGRYHLATGDPEGAVTDFLACGELMRRWKMDAPGLLSWRADAAEALLAVGGRDRARRLLEEQLECCDRAAYPRAHGNTLRILAGSYELRQRPMLLRSAADALQESEDRYLLAMTLCDLTAAYQDLGESRRARVIGRQAWNIAQECRAETISGMLAVDPGWPEPADTATGVLSDAQHRVAELVVQGLTNREIAKRLFITVSTVEQHLTHAYRKLGVAGRTDLAMLGSIGLRGPGSTAPAWAGAFPAGRQ